MKISKPIMLLSFMLIFCMTVMAQNPVSFSVQQKRVSPEEVDVIFTGKIAPGWHVYSTGMPEDGPTSATITTDKATGVQPRARKSVSLTTCSA